MNQVRGKIILKNAAFFAHHGIYDFERANGNEFEVDIEIEKNFYESAAIDLGNTVDYEKLHAIVAAEMAISQDLLETVAQNILQAVERYFTAIDCIRIEIRKLNPPIAGARIRHSAFQLEKNYQYQSI